MTRVGLIDVDGHNFPNLCLMKLSAHHKTQGDTVEWWQGPFKKYDIVYKSKVFDDSISPDSQYRIQAEQIIAGGTGYDLFNRLPEEIEHTYPDYGLYPQYGEAYGFLTRGCPRACSFCIVSQKEGRSSRQVAELSEFYNGQEMIKLLDPNILASPGSEKLLGQLASVPAQIDFTQGLDARMLTPDNIQLLQRVKKIRIHFAWDSEKDSELILSNLRRYKEFTQCSRSAAVIYVLTNFDTDFEFDLYRVYALREIGLDPYIMIYDKPNAPERIRQLQRWVNNRYIWGSCATFSEYLPRAKKEKVSVKLNQSLFDPYINGSLAQ